MSDDGESSDDSGPSGNGGLFEPYVSRESVRLTTVYATSWWCERVDDLAQPSSGFLRLGRLERFYERSQDQLPRVLARHEIDPSLVTCTRWSDVTAILAIRAWYFVLPSTQVMFALSVDVATALLDTIPLSEDMYYGEITIAGRPLSTWAAHTASALSNVADSRDDLLPERHQLLYLSIPSEDLRPDEDVLQRLIYRADLPCRPEYSSIVHPAELNRRPTTVGALGPYVSVIGGQQGYLENAVLLSAVQAVGGAAALREIRERAYSCVRLLHDTAENDRPLQQRRMTLEDLADTLRDLELELSFSVEATWDLGLVVPSLRVESYHDALCEAMSLARRAETTGHMLQRLRNAIAAELTTVQSIADRADEARRVRTVVAVTFVTTIAGTLSLLFGFFGINASEVDPRHSIFDRRYLGIYTTIALLIVGAIGIFVVMRAQERRDTQRHLQSREQHWRRHLVIPVDVQPPEIRNAASADSTAP